jgi:hypothetical protein
MPVLANPTFNLVDKPPFTQTFQGIKLSLNSGIYIGKKTSEERTNIADFLPEDGLDIYNVINDNDYSFELVDENNSVIPFDLTDETSLLSFITPIEKFIYIDITGIPTHIWANLIRLSIATGKKVKTIYSEPLSYTEIQPNVPSTYYSESQDIKPLPGLIVLSNPTTIDICFIPLIGFEKSRFDIVMNSVDPKPGNTYPIIGLPGFRIEYPFESYFINRSRLGSGNLWHNIRFASAWCPFTLFYQLQKLVFEQKNKVFKIGLTGTKPHSLGAIMFHLLSNLNTDLIYDFPKKKINNSKGIAKIHLHHVDLFIKFLNSRNGSC